jgi:hypothetical protein
MVTDWGSYIVEEDRIEEFREDEERIYTLDWDKQSAARDLFEEKWGGDLIVPA